MSTYSGEPVSLAEVHQALENDLGQRRLLTIRSICTGHHRLQLRDIAAIHSRLGAVHTKLSAEDYATLLVAVHTGFTPKEPA